METLVDEPSFTQPQAVPEGAAASPSKDRKKRKKDAKKKKAMDSPAREPCVQYIPRDEPVQSTVNPDTKSSSPARRVQNGADDLSQSREDPAGQETVVSASGPSEFQSPSKKKLRKKEKTSSPAKSRSDSPSHPKEDVDEIASSCSPFAKRRAEGPSKSKQDAKGKTKGSPARRRAEEDTAMRESSGSRVQSAEDLTDDGQRVRSQENPARRSPAMGRIGSRAQSQPSPACGKRHIDSRAQSKESLSSPATRRKDGRAQSKESLSSPATRRKDGRAQSKESLSFPATRRKDSRAQSKESPSSQARGSKDSRAQSKESLISATGRGRAQSRDSVNSPARGSIDSRTRSRENLTESERETMDSLSKDGTEDSDGRGFEDNDLNPETHTLTDFKELCKSVASLLHIEDGAAAAMLAEPLSGRRDLVEGLDAEAIFDYLAHHRVLDGDAVHKLRGMSSVAHRNKALLHRVEQEGPNAVALFINALRQSGQLHLASSLDNTQRIKPTTGTGYWEKQRHKGQVTITVQVRALLIVVPERDSDGDVIDSSILASPSRRHHQSYENMLMLESPDGANKSIRIVDYPYGEDDDDMPKKRSFFCFCFPRTTKKKKAKEKYLEQQQLKLSKINPKGAEEPPREVNGSGVKESGKVQPPEQDTPEKTASQPKTVDPSEVNFRSDSRRNSGSPKKEFGVDDVDHKNSMNEWKSGGRRDKENADPVIMEYNKKMELIRLKAQRHRDRSELKSDSSAIIMCEKWKSGGQFFRKKLSAFCQQFEYDLQTYIIKYFEQDRGTLVLSVWTDGTAMFVSNICLTVEQVRQLQKDYTSGVLLERLDALLRSNNSLEKLDIKDIDLAVVIEDEQFEQAFSDLS